jgi:hypothetical protein
VQARNMKLSPYKIGGEAKVYRELKIEELWEAVHEVKHTACISCKPVTSSFEALLPLEGLFHECPQIYFALQFGGSLIYHHEAAR